MKCSVCGWESDDPEEFKRCSMCGRLICNSCAVSKFDGDIVVKPDGRRTFEVTRVSIVCPDCCAKDVAFKIKTGVDWYDLDDELIDFITLMAEKYSINLEEVKKLVRLIFEYGFQCYCEGHRDSEAEEAMFND